MSSDEKKKRKPRKSSDKESLKERVKGKVKDKFFPSEKSEEIMDDQTVIDYRGFENLTEDFSVVISEEGIKVTEADGLKVVGTLQQPDDAEKLIIKKKGNKVSIIFK